MKENIFVDTSAFYGAKDKQEKHNKKSIFFLAKVLKNNQYNLITTNYILSETLTLMRYKLGHQIAVEFKEEIKKSNYCLVMRVTEDIEEQAWEIFKKYNDKEYSFVDCISFAFMKEQGIKKAFTFDSHFQHFGFELVV